MGILDEHKYKTLARKIEKDYKNLCSRQSCGECRYAFKSYCKTLFILDFLDSKRGV